MLEFPCRDKTTRYGNNMKLTTQQHKVFEQIKPFLDSDASVFILRSYAGIGISQVKNINCMI